MTDIEILFLGDPSLNFETLPKFFLSSFWTEFSEIV
jgi:hypothetical protein